MGGIIKRIITFAERSEYIDVEHLPSIALAGIIGGAFLFDIRPLLVVFRALDRIRVIESVTLLALQGVIGGIVTLYIYDAGENSFRMAGKMRTKEEALKIFIVITVAIGACVGMLAPYLFNAFPYPTLQSVSLVVVLGLTYLHRLISKWRLKNEWPHLLSGIAIIISPWLPIVHL